MKRLSLVALLISLMTSGAFAVTSFNWDPNKAGDWNDPNKWLNENGSPAGSTPDGTVQIQIRRSGSQCTLNTAVGENWANTQRLRVYDGAVLNIVNGGSLLGASWLRVGTADGPAKINQTGGIIRLKRSEDNSKLHIGDAKGSQGSTYTISGGTLTYLDGEGSLWAGYRGGEGKFTVVGTGPKIQMRKLYVGGDIADKAATGTLEFKIDSGGVSPIKLSKNIYIDKDGAGSKADLLVSAIAAPPKANIVLIEHTENGSVEGVFDTVNGNPAPEGAPVVLSYNGTDYHYKLTYKYDAGGDGNNNDIALIYASEPPKRPGD
jgi:hypothetical protein